MGKKLRRCLVPLTSCWSCRGWKIRSQTGICPSPSYAACVYIRHNVLFSNEPNITGPPNGYTCGVRVRVQGQLNFMIVNCYTPQPCTSFDWLTELGGKGRCLVTDDFNVRDSSWELDYESSSPTLTAQIDNSDFIVLNDRSFTRIPDRSDQRPSAIDLTLVTPYTASDAEWEVGADSLSSDHLPITVSFVFSAEKETPATTSKYNYDLANWDLFRNLLGTAERTVGDVDLDEMNRRIVSSILEAAKEVIPVIGDGLSRSLVEQRMRGGYQTQTCNVQALLQRPERWDSRKNESSQQRLQQDHSTGQEGSLDSLRGFYFSWEGGLRICVEEDQKNEAIVRCSWFWPATRQHKVHHGPEQSGRESFRWDQWHRQSPGGQATIPTRDGGYLHAPGARWQFGG